MYHIINFLVIACIYIINSNLVIIGFSDLLIMLLIKRLIGKNVKTKKYKRKLIVSNMARKFC